MVLTATTMLSSCFDTVENITRPSSLTEHLMVFKSLMKELDDLGDDYETELYDLRIKYDNLQEKHCVLQNEYGKAKSVYADKMKQVKELLTSKAKGQNTDMNNNNGDDDDENYGVNWDQLPPGLEELIDEGFSSTEDSLVDENNNGSYGNTPSTEIYFKKLYENMKQDLAYKGKLNEQLNKELLRQDELYHTCQQELYNTNEYYENCKRELSHTRDLYEELQRELEHKNEAYEQGQREMSFQNKLHEECKRELDHKNKLYENNCREYERQNELYENCKRELLILEARCNESKRDLTIHRELYEDCKEECNNFQKLYEDFKEKSSEEEEQYGLCKRDLSQKDEIIEDCKRQLICLQKLYEDSKQELEYQTEIHEEYKIEVQHEKEYFLEQLKQWDVARQLKNSKRYEKREMAGDITTENENNDSTLRSTRSSSGKSKQRHKRRKRSAKNDFGTGESLSTALNESLISLNDYEKKLNKRISSKLKAIYDKYSFLNFTFQSSKDNTEYSQDSSTTNEESAETTTSIRKINRKMVAELRKIEHRIDEEISKKVTINFSHVENRKAKKVKKSKHTEQGLVLLKPGSSNDDNSSGACNNIYGPRDDCEESVLYTTECDDVDERNDLGPSHMTGDKNHINNNYTVIAFF